MQILPICINVCNMLAWCCEMQALGSEMLVLGSDMLAKCSQMLATLHQYAGKVLPYANAGRKLLYDITAGPMQSYARPVQHNCSVRLGAENLAPWHHLAPRLVPNLAPDLAPGLAPSLSFGAIFFLAPGFGAETYHFWRHLMFWRRNSISGASFWRQGPSGWPRPDCWGRGNLGTWKSGNLRSQKIIN